MSNNSQPVNIEVLSQNINREYAGFWRRFVAYFIDALMISAIAGGLATVIGNTTSSSLASFVLSALYYVVMETSDYQGTLGKIALGIKVVDLDGNKLDYTKAIVRYLSKILSALILCIGYIMAAFTEKKQGLHDLIAGTLVVKK